MLLCCSILVKYKCRRVLLQAWAQGKWIQTKLEVFIIESIKAQVA